MYVCDYIILYIWVNLRLPPNTLGSQYIVRYVSKNETIVHNSSFVVLRKVEICLCMSVKEESEVLFSEETLILEATVTSTSMTVTPFATLAATTEPEKGVEGSSTTLLGRGTSLWLVGLCGWVSRCVWLPK